MPQGMRRISPHITTAFALALVASPASAEEAQPIESDDPLFEGGKLLLTNGVSSVEGSSGGGVSTWATIGGLETDQGVGLTGHVTLIELPDFGWQSHGLSLGIANRLELSYARQNFDTRDVGTALGLGRGYTFNQDVFGAKVRLAGDLVYGDPLFPQISAGVQHKRSRDASVVQALGAGSASGTDLFVSASKLFLSYSVLASATVRYTSANEGGLLGFGNSADEGPSAQFEASLAYQLSRRAVVGAELRTKPDNIGLGEDDWIDLFAAYALTESVTLTAAYVDLGSIATFENQRGGLLSAQIAF
jgi:hypothetical protein